MLSLTQGFAMESKKTITPADSLLDVEKTFRDRIAYFGRFLWRDRSGVLGLILFLVVVIAAVFAPAISTNIKFFPAKSETGLVGAGFLQKVATSAVTALQGFNTVKRIIGTKGPRGSKSSSRGGGFSAAASAAPTSVGSTDIANISSNNASRLGTDTSLSTNANQAALASTSVSGGGSNVVFSETAYSNFQNQVGFREDRTTIGG